MPQQTKIALTGYDIAAPPVTRQLHRCYYVWLSAVMAVSESI